MAEVGADQQDADGICPHYEGAGLVAVRRMPCECHPDAQLRGTFVAILPSAGLALANEVIRRTDVIELALVEDMGTLDPEERYTVEILRHRYLPIGYRISVLGVEKRAVRAVRLFDEMPEEGTVLL